MEEKKILLVAVNAKYIHSNPAVYSLRGYLAEERKANVEIAEYTINQSLESILSDLYRRRPAVLAFSCYIWNISVIRELLLELPKLLKGVPIWLGGPEVSYNAKQLLTEFPALTGIMVGEGEQTFAELVDYYLGEGNALTEISGLVLPSGATRPRELTEINRLPFLYEHPEQFENRIIYYESQRGCPFRCSYCLSSIDKTVRFRDMETVKKELDVFLQHKVKQVKFVDRTFNCKETHALAIWKYLSERDNGITNFHFEIAADCMTEAELEVLSGMRPGLVQLEIGVQTTNPQTLEAICRKTDLDRLADTVTRIRGFHNIHQHLDLIAGLPYEDYESFGKSFDWVYALGPQQLQLGFLKVLHGSKMEEDADKYGICYQDRPPYEVLYTNYLSYEEVCKLKQIEEMVELYYNSNQYVITLRHLVEEFSSPFALFEELAAFYERKGYLVAQPARSYRYSVLLDFIRETVKQPESVEFYRECLIYDCYLRENLKSRPEFAADLSEYKAVFREVYDNEERQHRYLPHYQGFESKQMAKMTHLEPFFHHVWETGEMARVCLEKPCFALFDYERRNALTGDAFVQVIANSFRY